MFTKDDLKTGVFVKLRDNRIGMVIEDNIIINKGGLLRVTAYNKSLCCVFPSKDSKFDIIEVRDRGKYGYDFNMFDFMDLKYQEKHFTKSDIKDGDIVITKYSNSLITYTAEYKYCKVGTVLVSLDKNHESAPINNFTEDLVHKRYGEVIMKVYRCNTADDYNILSHCNIVYEREE